MKVSALADNAVYGVITPDFVRKIGAKRLLYADLLAQSRNPATRHAAKMVQATVEAIQQELWELIL